MKQICRGIYLHNPSVIILKTKGKGRSACMRLVLVYHIFTKLGILYRLIKSCKLILCKDVYLPLELIVIYVCPDGGVVGEFIFCRGKIKNDTSNKNYRKYNR